MERYIVYAWVFWMWTLCVTALNATDASEHCNTFWTPNGRSDHRNRTLALRLVHIS